MLQKVKVENFRGIKSCEVADLALINVFIGPNNSCKSTLLDAIYWGLKGLMRESPRSILERRVMRNVERPELFYNYNENDLAIKVSLTFVENVEYSLKISLERETRETIGINDARYCLFAGQHVLMFERMGNEYYVGNLYTDLNLSSPYDWESYVERTVNNKKVIEYVKHAIFLHSHVRLDDLWSALDKNLSLVKQIGADQRLMERLKDYGIQYYEFLPMRYNIGQRIASFTENERRIFGAFQGAGAQRAALILSTLELLKNTGVFIEEMETYQHPSGVRTLAKHVIDLADRNNVQLFITTHSYSDCLLFLREASCSKWKKDWTKHFRCYKLERQNGIINVERVEERVDEIIRSLYPTAT